MASQHHVESNRNDRRHHSTMSCARADFPDRFSERCSHDHCLSGQRQLQRESAGERGVPPYRSPRSIKQRAAKTSMKRCRSRRGGPVPLDRAFPALFTSAARTASPEDAPSADHRRRPDHCGADPGRDRDPFRGGEDRCRRRRGRDADGDQGSRDHNRQGIDPRPSSSLQHCVVGGRVLEGFSTVDHESLLLPNGKKDSHAETQRDRHLRLPRVLRTSA